MQNLVYHNTVLPIVQWKIHLWKHLEQLYELDTKAGKGLRLIPKLKYEHLNLTSFSKMRVDLATQVF